ncbi:MAG: hypothetical protein AB8I08_19550 [Sandaracinaceae bacterium]
MSVPRSIGAMHTAQIRRSEWPLFGSFDADRYAPALRERAAKQWARRAREEYRSIHEFSELTHALTRVGAPLELLGGLARLITDEVRHAALCREMASCLVAAATEWDAASELFGPAPAAAEGVLGWAADVVIAGCCIGETLSRPLYETLATLITDPVPEAVVRQILKDEHLHARFGWETLAWLWPQLTDASREQRTAELSRRLGTFERACSAGHALSDLVGELAVEAPAEDAPPNLGHLPSRVYATVFYATLEAEVLPGFRALGIDADEAWRARGA